MVAAENPEFILFSFDVHQAFAKGMAFEELSEISGQNVRKVEFDVPKADLECPKQLPDCSDFNTATETFIMLKPICGFKDAPRAWRNNLHQVVHTMGVMPSVSRRGGALSRA